MDVTQTYVKPKQDKTVLDSVCHQDHEILFSQSLRINAMGAFITRRCESSFPVSGSSCDLQFTSLKFLRENWPDRVSPPLSVQLKEKIIEPQLTSPLPDPGILNGFRDSSPLDRHW